MPEQMMRCTTTMLYLVEHAGLGVTRVEAVLVVLDDLEANKRIPGAAPVGALVEGREASTRNPLSHSVPARGAQGGTVMIIHPICYLNLSPIAP